MRILPIGEPMALSLKPCLSRSALNSAICGSERARTLVPRIERNSMWRMPQDFSTSICACGSGEISSAKALRVNMALFSLHDGQLCLFRDEGALAALGEANSHFAHDAVA